MSKKIPLVHFNIASSKDIRMGYVGSTGFSSVYINCFYQMYIIFNFYS